jgi:DNA-binding NtrC family response regulator
MTITKKTVRVKNKQMLVVDDEPGIRRILEAVFVKDGYHVRVAENGRKALEILDAFPISVVITDLIMPDINGLDLLKAARQKRPDAIVVMITAYGTIKTAVAAIRFGASEYITKPFDVDEIRAIVGRAVLRASRDSLALSTVGCVQKQGIERSPNCPLSEILQDGKRAVFGKSAAMSQVWDLVGRAAKSRATVLIRGESGTGKELVARALHLQSKRAAGPFIAVSCAALPESLLESELFGHEKSAFTGAASQRIGRFELAHEGTLFLDEIGDISPGVQIKLLRVLQEREFERIGGEKTIKVDVRVVAATNSDLEALIEEGKFRKDLYYRLQVIQIVMPPLRERTEDIEELAAEFLRRFSEENERETLTISPQALDILKRYPWPGNVRELENVMERCVVMADLADKQLLPQNLPASIRENAV